RSVSAFLLNRSSDLGHVFCKLFNWRRLRTRRPKLGSTLPVGSVRIKCTAWKDRKSGSAGMPRPISYAVFCLKKKTTANANHADDAQPVEDCEQAARS